MASKAELLAEAYKRDILPVDKRRAVEEGVKRGLIPNPFAPTASTGESLLIGAGRGLTDAYEGAKQIALKVGEASGLADPGAEQRYTRQTDASRAEYDATPVGGSMSGKVGRVAGNVAPFMVIPGAGVGATFGTRVGVGMAQGAGMGAAQYVPEGGSRAVNTAIGGLIGGAVPVAGAALTKGRNAMKGGTIAPAHQEVIDAAKTHGVKSITLGDITQKPILQRAEVASEQLPVVGLGGVRERGQQEVTDATKNLVDKFASKVNYNTPAFSPITQSGASVDDMADVAQRSMVERMGELKAKAGRKFDALARAADPLGEFPLPRTQQAAVAAVDEIQQRAAKGLVNDSDAALMAKLKPFLGQSSIGAATGVGQSAPLTVNFTMARGARTGISNAISEYKQGKNALIGEQGVKTLSAVKQAIEQDIDTFATTQGGNIKQLYDGANAFYKNNLVPYRSASELVTFIGSSRPADIFKNFFLKAGPDKGQTLYSALPANGKAAVRAGILAQAAKDAMTEPATTGANSVAVLSPARFTQSIDRQRAMYDLAFTGADKAYVDGFVNLLNHMKRVGQYTENTASGGRAIPWMIAGAAGAANAGATASALGAAQLFKVLTTNRSMQQYLLSASALKPGSKAMEGILRQFEDAVTRAGISGSADSKGRDAMSVKKLQANFAGQSQ